jgi:YHS domain-containing protein
MKRTVTLRLFLLFAMALIGAPAHAHDVKDPVCRMMVDSDTTKFSHRLGSKTFFFCSQRCKDSFVRSPEKYEKLAAQLETEDVHQYTVDLTTARPPVAGKPVEMTFAIRYADTKETAPGSRIQDPGPAQAGPTVTGPGTRSLELPLVKEFEVVHERLLHVVMVTDDLAWFEHQHPQRGPDRLFRLTWTFPRPGRYRLYADFTPADGDNQVKQLALTVGGSTAAQVELKPDLKRVKQLGDYRVELRVQPEPLRMERATLLTYVISDRRGRPIRDMQPLIGAMGHLFAISEDGQQWVHTHTVHATASPPAEVGALHVTPAIATETGPAFSFKLTLPAGGLYKTWAQFMHDNRVVTVPFTFQVPDLWEKPTADGRVRQRTPAPTAPVSGQAASRQARVPGGRRSGVGERSRVQRATIVVDGGYAPTTIRVSAGRPVQLTFVRKEASGCGDVVQFPTLGLTRTLVSGQETVIAFTPRKAGTVPFTCGMSMYRGQVIVK